MRDFFKFLEKQVRVIIARAYVRVIGMNREPSWVIFDVSLPIMYLAAYCFLYRSMNADPVFMGYLVLGGSMIAFWMNVLWGMATQFYWEKEMGNLQIYFLSPVSLLSLLIGMALGGMYSTIIRAAITFLLASWLFHVPFHVSNIWTLFGVFFFTLTALYGLGMIGSSVFLLWGRKGLFLSELLHEPIFFLSGFYFPVRILGYIIAGIASILPVTLGLDGMRQLLYGGPENIIFIPVKTEILILIGLTIIYGIGAYYFLKLLEHRAKQDGRIMTRWL
ncbi:MAG: ABC transporter permease [Candidatus Eremiobacteraeota bacterium]|nr:ABC transporter permease [Candidatus Eremiobacteraeota bacterium]